MEGDNWMITVQAARWLIKRCDSVAKALHAVGWDIRRAPAYEDQWADAEIAKIMALQRVGTRVRTIHPVLKSSKAIVQAFERRAAGMAVDVWRKVRGGKGERAVQVEMHYLSNAFAQAMLVRNFWGALQADGSSVCEEYELVPKTARETMHVLFKLYSLHTLQQQALSFLTLTPPLVTLADLARLPEVLQGLMAELRPHAVPLVDAWAIPDYLLDSALGNWEGEVYERMWDWAHKQNPLNEVTIDPWYQSEQVVKGEGKYVAPWSREDKARL